MNTTRTLSDVVTEALTDAGLSHRQVEKVTGISRATLARKLADDSRFTVGELDKIADAAGITLSDLAGRREVAA